MREINKMSFDLESPNGLQDALDLISYLITNSDHDEYCLNDIHVTYGDRFAYVEWIKILKSREDDREWVFKDYDHLLVKQIEFPDKSLGFAKDEEEEKQLWSKWEADHPEWYQEDTSLGKKWVNKMEKYEDYPDDFVQTIKEHPACPFGHVKEPDYDAEWEKTQKQIIEEEKKPTPTIEEDVIIPPEGWEPQEVGENPMLDEIFDADEKKALEELEDEQREKAQQEDSSMGARHDNHY